MRAHLIVNPSSGTDRAVEMLPLMRSRLGALFEDLIVTGSRGLGDLQRMVSGSVAHDVLLHTGASVLVMRGQVHAAARERERATSTAAFAY